MKILFIDPYEKTLFNFREELVDTLISEGYQIILCIDKTDKVKKLFEDRVYKIIDVKLNLKDKNILSNLKLKKKYKTIIKEEKPDLIITYTIKPNLYCAFNTKRVPMIANITGLGNMFKSKNLLSVLGIFLYRMSFKNVDYVFFQNEDELQFFKKNKITINNYKVIPGSGVNTTKFFYDPSIRNNTINFLFASRGIKEKGFNLLIKAIPLVIKENRNVHFNFLVAEEDITKDKELNKIINEYSDYISVIDRSYDMASFYHANDFLVSPSYYREGISNVLLESLSCGRPIITTKDNPGCKEVLQDNVNGFGVISKDLPSLVDALIKASYLSKDTIDKMGLDGREFVIKNFERQIVIDSYLDVINIIKSKKS